MKRSLSFVLLAASVWSAMSCAAPQKTPAKTAPAAPITRISVSRTTNGWGGGEALDVTLRSNGTATWDKYKTTFKGPVIAETLNGKIPKARFDKIVVLLRDADFFALKPHYDSGKTDQARTTISAASGGKIWNVSSDGDGAPPAFFKIVRAMRAERDAIRWTAIESPKKPASKTASKSKYEPPLTREEIRIKAGDMGTCELHHVPLREGMAPISYGQPVEIVRGIFQARRALFPHAKTEIIGGCIVSEDSPQTRIVAFCPQCREAEAKWIATHRSTPKTRKSNNQ